MQIDGSRTSSEISSHGLPSKSKHPSMRKHSIVLIIAVNNIIVFTKQSSAERYLANMFLPVFFLQRIKKSSEETPLAKSYFSKVVGFYRSSHQRCPAKKYS